MSKPKWLKPPADIGEGAQRHWKTHAGGLFLSGRLTAETSGAFRRWCVFTAAAEEAATELGTGGVVTRSASGSAKASPALQAMIQAQEQADLLSGLFWYPAKRIWE